jgi:hypothetical protein
MYCVPQDHEAWERDWPTAAVSVCVYVYMDMYMVYGVLENHEAWE